MATNDPLRRRGATPKGGGASAQPEPRRSRGNAGPRRTGSASTQSTNSTTQRARQAASSVRDRVARSSLGERATERARSAVEGGRQNMRAAREGLRAGGSGAGGASRLGSLARGLGAAGTVYAAGQGLRAIDRNAGRDIGDATAERMDRTSTRREPDVNALRDPSRLPTMYDPEAQEDLRRGIRADAARHRAGQPGGNVPESARGMETGQGEELPFGGLPQVGAEFMDSIGPAGRDRVSPEREETVDAERGPAGIRSARADTQRAIDLQQQNENFAPSLEGDESEQDIITMRDGQGGTASIRAPAGMRRGGGTVSSVSNAAAAAYPTDDVGLRRARQAAADRGDWEAVERSFMDPAERRMAERESRREQLRDIVSSSQGMDQSVGGMMREGIRRRAAQQELQTMAAEDAQMRENQASLRRAQASNRPSPMERARFRRNLRNDEREQDRYNREQAIGNLERTFTDREGNTDQRSVDATLGFLERSNSLDMENPEDQRTARDLLETSRSLGEAIANRSGWTSVFAPDNPLSAIADSLSSGSQVDPDTAQQAMGMVMDAVQKVRTDRDYLPFDSDDEVIDIGGTEILVGDLPQDIRQRMRTLVERGIAGNASTEEISPSFRPQR